MAHLNFRLTLALILTLLLAPTLRLRAQDDSDIVVPGAEDSCIENLGYLGCGASGQPVPVQMIVIHWTALAISTTQMKVGASYGENSQASAEQTALTNCRRNGPTDCKIIATSTNSCLGLALGNPSGHWGSSPSTSTRTAAAAAAIAECRSGGGANCVTVAAVCAQDDARWPAQLPLPPLAKSTPVDPNLVGTWEFNANPGRWIWRIAANGAYEFHSENDDGASANAGSITATNGKWSITAVNMPYSDNGTYTYQAPGTLNAISTKLGPGTWHRISR